MIIWRTNWRSLERRKALCLPLRVCMSNFHSPIDPLHVSHCVQHVYRHSLWFRVRAANSRSHFYESMCHAWPPDTHGSPDCWSCHWLHVVSSQFCTALNALNSHAVLQCFVLDISAVFLCVAVSSASIISLAYSSRLISTYFSSFICRFK